jgi:hypothetical protein
MRKTKKIAPWMSLWVYLLFLLIFPSKAVALDPGLYIADWGTGFVSHMTSEGIVERFFPPEGVTLNGQVQLKEDPDGNLLVSVKNDGIIYRVTPLRQASVLVGGLISPTE